MGDEITVGSATTHSAAALMIVLAFFTCVAVQENRIGSLTGSCTQIVKPFTDELVIAKEIGVFGVTTTIGSVANGD